MSLCSQDEGEQMPMYFMFLTLMSLYVFVREQVDVAVMEVGIGGAYDCTNVIRYGLGPVGPRQMEKCSSGGWEEQGVMVPER